MKSFLIIGLSTYGVHLCKELARLDNEIMIADKDPAAVEAMVKYSVSAKTPIDTSIIKKTDDRMAV